MKNEIKKFECAVLSAFRMFMSINGSNVATMLTYVGLALLSVSAALYYRPVFVSKYPSGELFGTKRRSIRMALRTAWFFKRFTKAW